MKNNPTAKPDWSEITHSVRSLAYAASQLLKHDLENANWFMDRNIIPDIAIRSLRHNSVKQVEVLIDHLELLGMPAHFVAQLRHHPCVKASHEEIIRSLSLETRILRRRMAHHIDCVYKGHYPPATDEDLNPDDYSDLLESYKD